MDNTRNKIIVLAEHTNMISVETKKTPFSHRVGVHIMF